MLSLRPGLLFTHPFFNVIVFLYDKPLNLIVQAVGKRLSVSFTDSKMTPENVGSLVFIGEKGKINQKIIEDHLLSSQN